MARALLTLCCLVLSAAAVAQQRAARYGIVQAAPRVLSALGPSIDIHVTAHSLLSGVNDTTLRIYWEQELRARGKRPLGAAPTELKMTLSRGLQGGVWLMEIQRRETHQSALLDVDLDDSPVAGRALTVETKLLWQQDEPMLDVRLVGEDRLLVLEPGRLRDFGKGDSGWFESSAHPLPEPLTLSRDPRGRLWVEGDSVMAYASGWHCTLRGSDWKCEPSALPGLFDLGLTAGELDPNQNYFVAAKGILSGAPYFAAASFGDSPDPFVAVTLVSGELQLLRGDNRRLLTTSTGWGDEAASLRPECGGPSVLLTAAAGKIQAVRYARPQPQAEADPVSLPGRITALWNMDSPRTVAIAQNGNPPVYAAYLLTIACR